MRVLVKKLSIVLSILLSISLFSLIGCSDKSKGNVVKDEKGTSQERENSTEKNEETSIEGKEIVVTDMIGRKVTLPKTAKIAVAIGPGALRLYCYVSDVDKIKGIEQLEKDSPTGRGYIIAYPSLSELEIIGPGGPNNAPDAEKILSVNPDVVFTTYGSDKSEVDELAEKTGIPVVKLSYGKTSAFDESLYESIELIGKVMGDENRAEEVVEFMKKCENDLNDRTKDISDDEKPATYAGALSMRGAHGIESTQGHYSLFDAVNAKNVVDETGKTGSVMIDKEKLIEWNPDIIFIDYGGLSIVKEDYSKNPQYYETLAAFKDGEIYSLLPYNFYTTNIDTAIADAYYIGKVLYPEKFEDIDPEKKANEVYKFLLGKELYDEISSQCGKFGKVDITK